MVAWQEFEEYLCELLDGKRQAGSGNTPIQKGDVKAEDFLVECKYTSKDYYSLSYKTWEKICDEARNLFRVPLFACRCNRGDFLLLREIDWFDYCEQLGVFLDVDEPFASANQTGKSIRIGGPFEACLKMERANCDVVCYRIVGERELI